MAASNKQNNAKKGGVIAVAMAAVVVILALVGVIVYLLMSQNLLNNGTTTTEEKRNVVINPENVSSVLDDLNKDKEAEKEIPMYYTVTMDTTWHFKKGDEASYDAVVINADSNMTDVYFDIVLKSDETEVLYESPVIPLGGRLEKIALKEKLAAGTYDCVVIYHLIDEDQKTLSTVRVGLKIIIEG